MQRILNIISSFFFSLVVFVGVTFLGLAINDAVKGVTGIIILMLFLLGGIYFSYQIFIAIKSRGTLRVYNTCRRVT